MIRDLLQSLRLRFGLRTRKWPMALRVRRPEPYRPSAPFKVVQRDGIPMIEPRTSR